jgi:crotonobetainyl-CoA:carnitine CoA-transferase CaiB-like acyl-CoA transferase
MLTKGYTMTTPAPLLQGLHVVDLASFIAGPAATTVLSDFGADVIKVEPPGIGDTYRYLSRAVGNPAEIEGVDYFWQLTNRNKRGIALNLKSPGARAVLERLVQWADVLVTNFPPPTRAKLGLDYEQLAPLNPRLIYADITGFGEVGPDAGAPGFDMTAYWARTGLMDLMRQRSGPPTTSVWGSGDHPTAISLYAGIMTALYRREKTGQGSRVTASLIADGTWAAACMVQAVLAGAKSPEPTDRTSPFNALGNLYRTSDDRWLVLAFANEDKQFPLFLQAMGHAEAANDPRFKDSESRHAHAAEAVALLDKLFATRNLAEWRSLFDAAGLTYGVVQTADEIARDPQLIANRILVPIDDGSADPPLTIDSPVRIDQEQKVQPRPAPKLGEHTESVLTELGFDGAALEQLRAAGAIPPAATPAPAA